MKEKLYTIEVMDALKAADECPCCYLERKMEQDTIAFVLGASYMEDDIRAETDRDFCRGAPVWAPAPWLPLLGSCRAERRD